LLVLPGKVHWRACHFELEAQRNCKELPWKGIMVIILVIVFTILGIELLLQWGYSSLPAILVVKSVITKIQGMSLLLGVFKRMHP